MKDFVRELIQGIVIAIISEPKVLEALRQAYRYMITPVLEEAGKPGKDDEEFQHAIEESGMADKPLPPRS